MKICQEDLDYNHHFIMVIIIRNGLFESRIPNPLTHCREREKVLFQVLLHLPFSSTKRCTLTSAPTQPNPTSPAQPTNQPHPPTHTPPAGHFSVIGQSRSDLPASLPAFPSFPPLRQRHTPEAAYGRQRNIRYQRQSNPPIHNFYI